MIGTIDVEVNAAHPNLPLCEFAAFVGSPSHVRVRNVPRGVGNWQITAVYLSVNYPDNSIPSVSLTHVGALWTGTIQGSASAGRSVNGYQITADGVDEDGNAIIGYVLGVGDVIILNRDATISVNGVTYYLHWLDAVPDTPHIGDVATIDGSLKLYDGNAWVPFAAGASIDIVAPSTDPSDEGKAADAKATGDALAARPTKAQMDAGWWSKWTVVRDGVDVTAQVDQPEFYDNRWHSSFVTEDAQMDAPNPEGSNDATSLTWLGYDLDEDFAKRTYTATRHRISAPVPTKPEDIGAQPAGNYAPATNIAKSALASNVQTSLSKADTAVQPSALRYGLYVASVDDGDSVIEVERLHDRAVNLVTLGVHAQSNMRLYFPDAVNGKVRDFAMVFTLDATTSQTDIDPPQITFEDGLTFVNADGQLPDIASAPAGGKATTILYFSEVSANVFLVKGEVAREIA